MTCAEPGVRDTFVPTTVTSAGSEGFRVSASAGASGAGDSTAAGGASGGGASAADGARGTASVCAPLVAARKATASATAPERNGRRRRGRRSRWSMGAEKPETTRFLIEYDIQIH